MTANLDSAREGVASATCTPILLELQAMRDALLCAAASNEALTTINRLTDSMQVIHYLKKVAQTPVICQRIRQSHSKVRSKVIVSHDTITPAFLVTPVL